VLTNSKLFTNPISQKTDNSEGLLKIIPKMKYFSAYASLLPREKHSLDDESAKEQLKDCIIELYATLIEYVAKSACTYKPENFKERAKQRLKKIMKWDNWTEMLKSIEDSKKKIYLLSNAHKLAQLVDLVGGINTFSQDNSKILKDLLQVERDAGRNVATLASKQANSVRAALISRFKRHELDYDDFMERNDDSVDDTCRWFEGAAYSDWVTATSGVFLLTAGAGCGKSVLAKSVVKRLKSSEHAPTVCHFFFKEDNEAQKNSKNALCAILHQLFDQQPHLLSESVRHKIETRGSSLLEELGSLWDTLILASKSSDKPIICVLDALDECESHECTSLLKKLRSYFGNDWHNPEDRRLKLFLTSRPTLSVPAGLQNLYLVEDDDYMKRIHDEISTVIRKKVEMPTDSKGPRPHLTKGRKEILQKSLQTDAVSSTYLWIALAFKELEDERNERLRNVQWVHLATAPPSSLDGVYSKILSRARNLEETKTLLRMVLAAYKPLTWQEIDIALAIHHDPDCKRLDKESLAGSRSTFERRIRASCGLLITIHNGKVYLIHQTARTFLLATNSVSQSLTEIWLKYILLWRHTFLESDAHAAMLTVCGNCIRLNVRFWKGTFFQYSAQYWPDHAKAADENSNDGLLQHLCDTGNENFEE
jgi:hypothetical protein